MAKSPHSGWVDLHLHTTRSDGTLSPETIIEYAHRRSLVVVSITDHDTVSGVGAAIAAARSNGLRVIPGIEISARFTGGTLHLLGYHIDLESQVLIDGLKQLQSARQLRNRRIIDRLQSLGVDIADDQTIIDRASMESIGRPHIASILIRRGVVPDMGAAFDQYLGKRGRAYVDKEVYSAEETIGMIRKSGGLAVLAHPSTLNLDPPALRAYIGGLKEQGLDGIEVYSSAHSREQIEFYRDCCHHFGFLISGGSDFHGGNKNGVEIGICNDGRMIEASSLSSALLTVR
jgi:3',5'-nucleoside bisphosphate phosphatase